MSKRLEVFEAMIAKGSVDPFVFYARAMELRSVGRVEEALAAYAEVAERFSDYVPTYLMAAQVAAELGRREEARAFAARGIDVATKKRDGHALSELESMAASLADGG